MTTKPHTGTKATLVLFVVFEAPDLDFGLQAGQPEIRVDLTPEQSQTAWGLIKGLLEGVGNGGIPGPGPMGAGDTQSNGGGD